MSLVLESCNRDELCIALGASEKLLNQLRDELEDWMKLQPHLPQDASERRLEWFILNSKMRLEMAKQKLDMYYTVKQLIPEFFANRDPRGHNITLVHNGMLYAMIPKSAIGKSRTFIFRITETDSSKLLFWDLAKYIFMVADIRMIEDRNLSENYVFDLSMINLGHLMKFTPTLVKKCEIAASKAYAMRIKGIHFINAPPYVDLIVTIIKSVISPKLLSKFQMHVHPTGNLEQFYQFVPQSILPRDYGGDEPSMTQLDAMLREKVDEWRDWFLKDEKIIVNESLRPSQGINQDNLFGFHGSFRKLEVD